MWRNVVKRASALVLLIMVMGSPTAGALPVFAHGSGNVTRLAQARWTTGRGESRIRWTLDARESTYAYATLEPGTVSGAQILLDRTTCDADGCRNRSRSWTLGEDNFIFDPLLNEVRVSLPGKAHLVWKATQGHQLVTERRARPRIYDDPYYYVGVEAEVEGVAAIRRPAKVSGRIKGYPGRISVTHAEIYQWTGASSFGGVCVVDQGYSCL